MELDEEVGDLVFQFPIVVGILIVVVVAFSDGGVVVLQGLWCQLPDTVGDLCAVAVDPSELIVKVDVEVGVCEVRCL